TSEERAIGLPPLPICPLDCCCVHWSHCRARWALLGSRFWALAVTEASTSTAMVVRVADRKSTRLNSSHVSISYAVLCLKKKIEARSAWNELRTPNMPRPLKLPLRSRLACGLAGVKRARLCLSQLISSLALYCIPDTQPA